MSISKSSFASTIPGHFANARGISWAWQNGADVISNSWEVGCYDQIIADAVDNAITFGRNGKGCVVVFCSHNKILDTVSFPASLPTVIAVGAISPCGERKSYTSCDTETGWGSNYGEALDIVAPGVLIATTDLQGQAGYNPNIPIHVIRGGTIVHNDYTDEAYTVWFNGTSAATPHVSGVAALIISVAPNLTGQGVRDIIESTAQKIRPDLYDYQNTVGRPNGTWHEEMGYGLVDAYEAVSKAICNEGLPVVRGVITQNSTWNTQVQAMNVVVTNGVTLIIQSEVKCSTASSIIVESGGKLVIDGGRLTNACEGEMWKGITVWGDYINAFPPGQIPDGIVEIRNGGTIENAIVGIHAKNGGIVETIGAFFINNKIGVQADPFSTANFTETQFVINRNYPGDIDAFGPHIKLLGSIDTYITKCNFSNEVPFVSPIVADDGTRAGIWAFNAPLTIQKESTFSGLGESVSARNSGAVPRLCISNNQFYDTHNVAIHAINYSSVANNIFDISNFGARGLSISNATGYRIEDNNFMNSNNAIQTMGILITNSGETENIVVNNSFVNLNVGIHAIHKNSSQSFGNYGVLRVSGLQFLCNGFEEIQQTDILVGDPSTPHFDHSVKNNQGNSLQPAGNLFIQNQFHRTNIASYSNYQINYFYSASIQEENPLYVTTSTVTKVPLGIPSKCPPFGKERGDLENALAQYDEWNVEYEYWLTKILTTSEDDDEFIFFLDMVSYFGGLKDNYFNSIIMEVLNNYELQITNYEELRFLFSYRGHYTDYLSIVETFLAENNFSEAFAAISTIYEMHDVSEEQFLELIGLQTYILWLQQLNEKEESIYKLPEREILYLTNYVNTHKGRGKVFVNNILCGLYGICNENDEIIRGLDDETIRRLDEIINNQHKFCTEQNEVPTSASSAYIKSLENITLMPNPTTGELRVTSYELQVTGIEVYDIYGRKVGQPQLLSVVEAQADGMAFNISHLPPSIYFVLIVTKQGSILKKLIKQ
jgi:hypothetical protein